MRRLVLWVLLTLDGRFEGSGKWDLAFHEVAWGPELEAFSLAQAEEVGVLLFGRVTYEGMAAHWAGADGPIAAFMNGVEKVVVSTTLKAATWANTRLLPGGVVEEIRRMKKGEKGSTGASAPGGEAAPTGDLFVFGSAELAGTLLDAGVVDEVRIGLVPVVLGSGTPFFRAGRPPLHLDLVESRPLGPGCTLLRYHVPDPAPGPEGERTEGA